MSVVAAMYCAADSVVVGGSVAADEKSLIILFILSKILQFCFFFVNSLCALFGGDSGYLLIFGASVL